MSVDVAIIGGTATIDTNILNNVKKVSVETSFGKPSDDIIIGDYEGKRIAVLHRHGKNHSIPPHLINHCANIVALHKLGVKRIIATAAVGSLKEEYKAGDVVVPDQFIDFGKKVHTIFGEGKFYHVSMADPFCPQLRKILINASKDMNLNVHEKGTYIKIDGPQFSTRAASRMYRQFGDIIGMTCVPEAIIAREKQMCIAVLATITDYDVWAEKPVSYEEIKNVMKQNIENMRKIICNAVKSLGERSCNCHRSLEGAEA